MCLLLRVARIRQQVSAKIVARKLGVSPGYVRSVEIGTLPVTHELKRKFIKAYGVDSLFLLQSVVVDVPEVSLR